jgi:hypothetical protein
MNATNIFANIAAEVTLLTYTNTSSIKDVSPLTEITVWALMPNVNITARSYHQKGPLIYHELYTS